MIQKMPLKLQADPIIDAIIEVRLKASKSLSDILPGVLMQSLGDKMGAIQRLPVAEIPKQLRDSDPNLAYQHLVRIDLQGFGLFISDKSITLSCVMPYPSGSVFKKKAVDIFREILALPFIEEVERCSIKYIDLIKGQQFLELIKYLNLDITAGQKNIDELEGFSLEFKTTENNIINLVKVTAAVSIKREENQPVQTGALVEVDSIYPLEEKDAAKFNERFSNVLDSLHQSNKEQFFSLLTSDALGKLGAIYAN